MELIQQLNRKIRLRAKRAVNRLRSERIPNLDATQWWKYEDLKRFQDKRLVKMVSYAYQRIPAYKKKFDAAGIKPSDIKTTEDLPKLPVTTRREMQDNQEFINQKLVSAVLFTGGSTGESLRYFESFESGRIRLASHLRGWSWNGYFPGEKRLAVVASAQGTISASQVINLVGDMSANNIDENLERLLEFQPQHLRGYVNSLYLLARHCINKGVRLDFVESINPISENLYDYQRIAMEEAFGCRVFDEYCCNDGGACAWECEMHEGLHYCMERSIIENLDGKMFVTDLWNRAMPFIRYENGDLVTFLDDACTCGRELPLMKVTGRTNEVIVSPSGPISPSFLMYHGIGYQEQAERMGEFRSGIAAVQYIQKKGYILVVNMVLNDWCTDHEISEFHAAIEKIAAGMEIRFRVLDALPSSPKGKRQFIINQDKELLRKWSHEN